MIIKEENIGKYQSFNELEKRGSPYTGTNINKYKEVSGKVKGKYFELLFQDVCEEGGFVVEKAGTSSYDRLLIVNNNSFRTEIKASLLWGEDGRGGMRWQQIRIDQDYDILVFIAAFPDRVEFKYSYKKEVAKVVDVQDEDGNWPYNQHGGKKVRSGAFFLHGLPNDFPFMKPLSELLEI